MYCHPWNVSVSEAKTIQERLSQKIIVRDEFKDINYVAGTDVGINSKQKIACGAVIVLKFPELSVVERAFEYQELVFPYIPGYLSFREAPVLIRAFENLSILPNLILCDGQGIAHPRNFGLACHMGLLTGIPTIGVAKSRLIGSYSEPKTAKGFSSILYHQSQQIGNVIRTRTGVKPLFVSPGHKIGFRSAVTLTLACCTRYKLPETTRLAHKFATELTATSDFDV